MRGDGGGGSFARGLVRTSVQVGDGEEGVGEMRGRGEGEVELMSCMAVVA